MNITKKIKRTSWVTALVVSISLILLGLVTVSALAAPITSVDDGGPDDVSGTQKDLNSMTVDYAPGGGFDIVVTWNWDDTGWSGGNSGDAQALFDTDGDGNINFTLAVEVAGEPAHYVNTILYSCSDNKPDRCTSPNAVVSRDTDGNGTLDSPITKSSTGAALVVANSDPFGVSSSSYYSPAHADNNDCVLFTNATSGCITDDTIATVHVKLSDFGTTPAPVKLVNVCSFPSGQPGSDPSDCIFKPASALLTIVKVANPNDGTNFIFNASAASQGGVSQWTIPGSGSVQLISYAAGTYNLNEVVPTGWKLDSASCILQAATPTPTGTPTVTGVNNFTLQEGLETICTFYDTPAVGTLTLIKEVNNLGESGPGYLGVSDFPLTIDGNATTSGTPVTVVVGNHTIAETAQTGYTVGTWSCTDGTTGSVGGVSATVNISGGENTTCTMINTLIAAPHLAITKVATETSFDTAGQTIHYTIVATNDGNVTLAAVTVSDPNVSGLTCTPANGSSLAPGASMTCTATHTVTQADLDAGHYANTACVDDGTGGAAEACARKDVPGTQLPALNVLKSVTSTGPYDSVGDVITYDIVVTNIGNQTLTGVTVTDPGTGVVLGTCTPAIPATLAPLANVTCTASHSVTQADIDAGSFTNVAFGDSDQTAPDSDDEIVPITQLPALNVLKSVTSTGPYDSVGDVITYDIVVTNIGNQTLTGVTVTDPGLGVVLGLCTPAIPATIAPTEFVTCVATHSVTQADIDAGSFTNVAFGDSDQTAPDSDNEIVQISQLPALSLTKSALPITYDHVGQTIAYTFVLKNTGNVTLSSPFAVSDDKATDESCPATPTSLAPGDSITCTATYAITQGDLDAGSVTNTATATAKFGNTTVTSNQAQATVNADQNPALSIVKVATETTYKAVGNMIHYTIVATNDGNVTLHNVDITDAQVSDLVCTPTVPVANLAPLGTISCTASHTITQPDLDAGHYYNQSCVDDGTGGADVACADETVYAQKGALLPTQTTCQQYAAGPSAWPAMYDAFVYQVKGNKINSVSPGVIFYYNTITAPSASFDLTVVQTNTKNWNPMLIQDLGQAMLYTSDCSKASGVTVTVSGTTSPYTVTFNVTGATSGATYYIGIKYSPQNLIGQSVPGKPTSIYSWSTTGYAGSDASIPVKPKK